MVRAADACQWNVARAGQPAEHFGELLRQPSHAEAMLSRSEARLPGILGRTVMNTRRSVMPDRPGRIAPQPSGATPTAAARLALPDSLGQPDILGRPVIKLRRAIKVHQCRLM